MLPLALKLGIHQLKHIMQTIWTSLLNNCGFFIELYNIFNLVIQLSDDKKTLWYWILDSLNVSVSAFGKKATDSSKQWSNTPTEIFSK